MRKAIPVTEIITIVITILILTAFSIPRHMRLRNEAKGIAELATVGNIQAGLYTYVARTQKWPYQLDDAKPGTSASKKNAFFSEVYPQGSGVTEGWSKSAQNPNLYHSPTGNMYEYNTVTGEFLKL